MIHPGPGITNDSGVLRNASDKLTWEFEQEWRKGANILGLVVLSIIMGFAIAVAGEGGKPLHDFFLSMSVVMMKLTTWILYMMPVGTCFLIAGQILAMDDLVNKFAISLAWYFATNVITHFIHGAVILPSLYSEKMNSISQLDSPLNVTFQYL